jgi:hypothetical protein
MTDRVRRDDSLVPPGGELSGFIRDPVIIVHQDQDRKLRYLLQFAVVDEGMGDPRFAGVILSDLLDHAAAAYAATTGRDQRDVRAVIAKVMRDEDKFKEKDPSRGQASWTTVWPRRN